MNFEKKTPIIVQTFHYDLNQEQKIQNEVNIGFRKVSRTNDDGSVDTGQKGTYFEVLVVFEVSPAPGDFTVSGRISQIVDIEDYFGDGSDIDQDTYMLLTRPLVEYIETLTYEVTQVTLDKPVNLNFKSDI